MSTETTLESLHDDDEPVVGTAEGNETPDAEFDSPRASEPAAEPNSEPASEPADSSEPSIESGVEEWLSQFGVEGGMISFEDGENKHFNDLSELEKLNVLNSLSTSQVSDIEGKYDLTEEEIEFLNAARTEGQGIDQVLESLAQQRVEQILALQQSSYGDIEAMPDDAIYTKWIKESNPDATEEEITAELERAKESKFFQSNVENIKKDFIQKREIETRQAEEAEYLETQNELEEQRRAIVGVVQGLDKISGWDVNDEDKNQILEKVLEVNEFNDSKFMEEVFSDPANIFKAAYLYYNADAKFDQLENYYKKEIQEAYKRGRREISEGLPSQPIAGTARPSSNTPSNSGVSRKPDAMTLDDLHDD